MPQRPHSSWTSILGLTVFIVIMASLGRGCIWRDREFRLIQHGLEDVEQYAQHIEDAAVGADERKAIDRQVEATGTAPQRMP